MTPTPEQRAIIEASKNPLEMLLVNALAGASKTTTLVMVAEASPNLPTLSLAFNKRIAEEMTKRLPGHTVARTLNSLGHRAWAPVISKKIFLDTKKSYNILKGLVDSLPRAQRSEAYETFADTLKAIGAAKAAGYIPEGKFPQIQRVANGSFWESFEEEPTDLDHDLIDRALTESIQQAYNGLIDFDDQIYMPTLFGGTFPRFPRVMVDEAQDLSPLNHLMLQKLTTSSLIAVGDPHQSIYGFRGAMVGGMRSLRDTFNMAELGLSISFRCPVEIVKLAQKHAPHMQWADGAKPGSVQSLDGWSPKVIPEGAAIICRNNAPLFSCAMSLLRSGRGVSLVGSDIGPGLVKALKGLGSESLRQDAVYTAIDKWEAEKKLRSKSPGAVLDRADCLRVFAGQAPDLGGAIAYAQHLFKSEGPVQLLSGHKAKGLEWDNVFHLDPWRVPSKWATGPEALSQENNVEYVITTRSKDNLTFINMEGLDA